MFTIVLCGKTYVLKEYSIVTFGKSNNGRYVFEGIFWIVTKIEIFFNSFRDVNKLSRNIHNSFMRKTYVLKEYSGLWKSVILLLKKMFVAFSNLNNFPSTICILSEATFKAYFSFNSQFNGYSNRW